MFEESEIVYLRQIGELEKRLELTASQEVVDLRAKV